MANDLISRSALIDELRTENQICITTTGHELTMNMVYSFINKQPTAYDVEKVVEQLQDNRDYHQKEHSIFFEDTDKGMCMAYDDAIDIVRKGGLE